jgi:error-prone DNA polymerase
MIEGSDSSQCVCNVCSHEWSAVARLRRFRSIDELVRVVALRRDEVTALAEIGALNSFGFDRRSALWQAERAVRPAGELFEEGEETGNRQPATGRRQMEEQWQPAEGEPATGNRQPATGNRQPAASDRQWALSTDARAQAEDGERSWLDAEREVSASPLEPMTETERLVADYAGTGITVGPHPMGFRRHELATKGVLRAIDLPQVRNGRRVRTAGMVITRQRPGTAKGFVFLTLEDETGISNVIVRPDVYARDRAIVVDSPFLLVEGILQVQDGVTAIKAERMERLEGLLASMAVESHDFH